MRTLKRLIEEISKLPKGEKSLPVTDEEATYLLENLNKTTKLISDDFQYRQGKNIHEVEYLHNGRIFNLLFTIDKKTEKNISVIFTSMEFWELCSDVKIS